MRLNISPIHRGIFLPDAIRWFKFDHYLVSHSTSAYIRVSKTERVKISDSVRQLSKSKINCL